MISVLLDCLFSFCKNQYTEGRGESESTGTNPGLVPTERQTTAKMYILTQSSDGFPGHLVETESICTKSTDRMR